MIKWILPKNFFEKKDEIGSIDKTPSPSRSFQTREKGVVLFDISYPQMALEAVEQGCLRLCNNEVIILLRVCGSLFFVCQIYYHIPSRPKFNLVSIPRLYI